jgi:hypothetical protein
MTSFISYKQYKLNEKFENDSDPIADLGIGITQLEEILGIRLTRSEGKYIWNKNLDLENNRIITELPDNLYINGWLDLEYTNITKLPNNLYIENNLWIKNTKITKLPHDLYVGKFIYVNRTQISNNLSHSFYKKIIVSE